MKIGLTYSDNFDWQFYLQRYQDLTRKGLSTERHARWHYYKFGKKEGRLASKYMLNSAQKEDLEAKERAEQEAKERAEQEAKERERLEQEAKKQEAKQKAKQKAEQEAKQKAEQKAEQEAKKQEAKQKAEQEQIRQLLEQVPSDFNAKQYILLNEGLYQSGIKSERQAKLHYVKYGKAEGKKYKEELISSQQIQNINLTIKEIQKINNKNELLNILIRNTYRPTFFKKCIESILSQTYVNYKIIMCYDDDNCLEYLNDYINHEKIEIFKATEVDKSQTGFYNLYCNELLTKVKDGWIMFLDDDDMLTNDNSLAIIIDNITNIDDFLIWKVQLGKIIVYPPNINDIKIRDITTCGICFHSKNKHLSHWESKLGSDWIYFSKLLETIYKKDKRIFIDNILTKTIHNSIGQLGIKDNTLLEELINKFSITQLYVSESLIHLKPRFLNKYKLIEYNNTNDATIFFGLYRPEDFATLLNHNIKNRFIIFGGSDVPNVNKIINNKIINNNNIRYISISKNIQTRLKSIDIYSILVQFDLVDKTLFKPILAEEKNKSTKIFVYNGIYKKPDNDKIYNQSMINQVVKQFPDQEFIYSSELNAPYEKMPEIYAKCFIGLRLTQADGNANMVQEMEAMEIPVVYNHSNYGLKWRNVDDVVQHIENENHNKNTNFYDLSENEINMFSDKIDNTILEQINLNIDKMSLYLEQYKNILFICSDYPGYGGAATNCYQLSKFYEKTHNVYSIYWNYQHDVNKKIEIGQNYQIINQNLLGVTVRNLRFKPDIIILKSAAHINLKTIYKCPILYFIPGIYNNNLDKHYLDLNTKEEHDKYINRAVINQIKNSSIAFCNSSHTRDILKNVYGIETGLFYSSFVPFYREKIPVDVSFNERKYEYGLIVSDFSRKIKNVEQSIEFLKSRKSNNDNVILIGKGSSKYNLYDFECIENVEASEMTKYYKQIKYIVQDSFFESCSNVLVEGLFNGCKFKPVIVISSTQYPGYGGAATNAYELIKEFRRNKYNVCGVFFHNDLNVNYDPDNIGGIYLYTYNYDKFDVKKNTYEYLKTKPTICLAKNYLAPQYCKDIFECYTVYLVSGINHVRLYYSNKSALELLDNNFIIDKNFDHEIKTINIVDKIIINSELTKKIFLKIYPNISHKITDVVDTTIYVKKLPPLPKINDIIIVCSILTRKDKNNMFLLDILKDPIFNKYSKIIIGENYDDFINIPNCKCIGLCNHTNTINYMNKSKILLFPSLFDSNSNTVREAYYHGCLPMISRNVGFAELFPDYLICNNFMVDEWVNKVKFVLYNYDYVKNTRINYKEKLDIQELIN